LHVVAAITADNPFVLDLFGAVRAFLHFAPPLGMILALSPAIALAVRRNAPIPSDRQSAYADHYGTNSVAPG
jgi:hypothetical protein